MRRRGRSGGAGQRNRLRSWAVPSKPEECGKGAPPQRSWRTSGFAGATRLPTLGAATCRFLAGRLAVRFTRAGGAANAAAFRRSSSRSQGRPAGSGPPREPGRYPPGVTANTGGWRKGTEADCGHGAVPFARDDCGGGALPQRSYTSLGCWGNTPTTLGGGPCSFPCRRPCAGSCWPPARLAPWRPAGHPFDRRAASRAMSVRE